MAATGPVTSTLKPAVSNWIDGSATRHYVTLIASVLCVGLVDLLGARVDWRVYAVMGAWVAVNAIMSRWARKPAAFEQRLSRYGVTIAIDVIFLGVAYVFLDAAQYLGIAFFAHMAVVASTTLPRRQAYDIAALIVLVYLAVVVVAARGVVVVTSPIGLAPVVGNRLFVVAGLTGAFWTVVLLMRLQSKFVRSLAEAERRYATLVKSASDMVMTFDSEGRFVEVNPATIEQTGYSWEELKRLPNEGFFPESAWPTVLDVFRRTQAGEAAEVETRYIRKDGAERWVHVSAFPLVLDQLAVTVAIARDVTDAHRRHAELSEKDERLRIVLAALNAGAITFDGEGRVTSVLGDWGRMEDLRGLRLVGPELRERFLPDVAGGLLDRHSAACERVLAGEEVSVTWTHPIGGIERSFRSHLVPLRDAAGNIAGGVSLFVEETALVAAERERSELQRRIADVERMESLGKLVSGVAHELNNPLAAILNFAEDLLADARTPEDRLALEVIQAQALRSRTIVRDLLTYGRRDAARPLVVMAPEPILGGLARAMQHGFATEGVGLSVELRDADVPVALDRAGFEQVVTNLLTNAAQAAGAGGSVRLSSRARNGFFEVVIEDNGAGIPPEVAARMFEPFFTTKPTGRGVGLGLSVSAGIAHAHGGTLTAENRPADAGGGARFVLRIPLAGTEASSSTHDPGDAPGTEMQMLPRDPPAPGAAASPIAEPPSQPRGLPGRRPTILIIDDEAAIRQGLRRYLVRRGWVVEESSDGAAALARLLRPDAAHIYDVVLCDLKMAGVSGMDVYERVLDASPGMGRRFILSTGDTSAPDVAGFLAQVTVPVLEKPYELAALESVAGRIRAGAAAAGSAGRAPA